MRSAVSILSLALLASACIPSFEKVECYNDIDCPGGGDLVCSAENTCVSASADAGFPDSGVPTGAVTVYQLQDPTRTGHPAVDSPVRLVDVIVTAVAVGGGYVQAEYRRGWASLVARGELLADGARVTARAAVCLGAVLLEEALIARVELASDLRGADEAVLFQLVASR